MAWRQVCARFYLDGKPFAKGQMLAGLRQGAWQYWNEDGSINTNWSGVYKDGEKVAEWPQSGGGK
ncbi:MAG: hypothetical protein R3E96_05220 [Planctomycetota bacterium]